MFANIKEKDTNFTKMSLMFAPKMYKNKLEHISELNLLKTISVNIYCHQNVAGKLCCKYSIKKSY